MRPILAAMLAVLALAAAPASRAATTWGTDMSDWWWLPSEDGWAVNISHQGDTLFIAMYVYGADRQPRWYTAALSSLGGANAYTFSGALYETTGPYFANPFDPASVTRRVVGTANLRFPFIDSGAQLDYTIDGITRGKVLQRFTFRNANLTGSYVGVAAGTIAGCASGNGAFENSAYYTINHSATGTISISALLDTGTTCTYSGTYTQVGRMGSIGGTMTCTNGASATFDALEVEAGHQSFVLRYSAGYGGSCTETGRMAATVRN